MHLRIFGCKCYVHNNGKDALRKFDPRSDEAIFLSYSSNSKAYKVFNKRTLCAEKSVHVLFDEFNSFVENGAQGEDFELGLAKKDMLPTHEESKHPQEGSGTGPVSVKGEQGDKYAGGTATDPYLEQNKEADSRIDLQTGAGTSSKTGARTAPKQCAPENRVREESVVMDSPAPRAWKHYKSHPLDQILTDLNSGVQTRSRLKNFCAFYAFLSHIEPKNVYIALADSDCSSCRFGLDFSNARRASPI